MRAFAKRLLTFLLLSFASTAAAQTVFINEYMSSNTATRVDVDGAYSDWIELYNPGAATVNLTGCWLSDDAAVPLKWQFPQGSVPAHGWLLVWASDKNGVRGGGQLHTNFKLGASGEPVLLTAANGVTLLDQAPAMALTADRSYARQPDGGATWSIYPVATPGAANGLPTGTVPAPLFSRPAGFRAASFSLSMACLDQAAQIRYTLDGSVPTATSPLYTAPFTVDDRADDPNFFSLIPTNFIASGHEAWRPPAGNIDKITVVRARAFRSGLEPSAVVTQSFIVGAEVASRCFFPVISLATDPANLFDDATGIYVPGNLWDPDIAWSGNYFESGSAWERPVHVELFDASGGLVLSQDAGARISGSWTVRLPQKSLKLYADAEYGDTDFSTQLFPDLPYSAWARFRLRSSGDDWCRLGFRDLALHTMFGDMGFDTQAGRPVIQFLDGEYWGLANLRDEYSRFYYERVYGIPESEVVLLENNGEVDDGPADANLPYFALRDYVAAHDMNNAAAFAHADSLMDMANYIAWCTAEIYAANTDWPDNNVVMWRRNTAGTVAGAPYGHDGKWRWSLKDMDACFHWADYDALFGATQATDVPAWSTELLRGLLENDGFRSDFINAMAAHLNTTFRPSHLVPIIDGYADQYEPAIPTWYARWDVDQDWAQWVSWLREFTDNRPPYVRQHYQAMFGLPGTGTVVVHVSDPARGSVAMGGVVIDANTAGLPVPGSPFPFTGTWFRGNPVTITALPEPGSVFVRWLETGETTPATSVMPAGGTITRTAVFAAAAGAAGAPGALPAATPRLVAAPNPFNPRTELRFEMASGGFATLEMFDIAGRRVRVLAAGALAAGPQAWTWDGCDDAGRSLPSGTYLGRLRTPGGAATVKVQLVR
ncbi:MAG: CotH kinase family protein [bacterium]|nr:CotH kinase family protein [bacterium]